MTITKDTGIVMLPEIGASIDASLLRSQFLQAPEFSDASVFLQNEPWCSYRLPPIPQTYTDLTVMLQFHQEQLVSVQFCHGAACFGKSWSDWSEERELARKAFHERWLTGEVGLGPGPYPWGEISSYFDPKGGFSAVTLSYVEHSALV
jgi:hypothetical protein